MTGQLVPAAPAPHCATLRLTITPPAITATNAAATRHHRSPPPPTRGSPSCPQVRRSAAQIRSSSGADSDGCSRSIFSHLAAGCDNSSAYNQRSPSAGDMGPIGSDPVYSVHSALYLAKAQPGDYYNTSQVG
jgi:hypothetical protein